MTHRLADFLSRSGGLGHSNFVPTNVGAQAFGRRKRHGSVWVQDKISGMLSLHAFHHWVKVNVLKPLTVIIRTSWWCTNRNRKCFSAWYSCENQYFLDVNVNKYGRLSAVLLLYIILLNCTQSILIIIWPMIFDHLVSVPVKHFHQNTKLISFLFLSLPPPRFFGFLGKSTSFWDKTASSSSTFCIKP